MVTNSNIDKQAFEWLDENQLSYDIWNKKYRFNNESFEEWLNRVSNGNKSVQNEIFNKRFIFGGRILANRGTQYKQKVTFSNCYVIPPVEDSIEGIYNACAQLARTYSYGGGCGVDISNLRPKGATVNNSAKETTGAVSFMKTFNEVTQVIGQHGRRGALMISIDINHPDVEEFINIKANTDEITSANISVRVNDAFMRAVENNDDYILRWPCDRHVVYGQDEVEYNKLYYKHDTYFKVVKAKDLFTQLCKNNWNYAEPGILYWDSIEHYNLLSTDKEFKYAGVNPCAEEPLPAGGSCLLGSINLAAFVKSDKTFDIEQFRQTVGIGVNALNEVLFEGMPLHPLKVQTESVFNYRQIGLGIMGLADMLIKMEIKYGSPEAIEVCDTIGNILAKQAIHDSFLLTNIYGKYPKYNHKIFTSPFYNNHNCGDCINKNKGLVNSQLLTIAPTGTLSTLFNISGGIEPIFAKFYTRTTKSLHNKDVTYTVYPKIIEDYMKEHNIQNIDNLPDYFVSSEDIPWENRLNMQATWQKHIDASISSTLNLPENTTVEDVYNIYMQAWKKGLKGITIFRENCARLAILNKGTELKEEIPTDRQAPKRPKTLEADCYQVKVKGETFIVMVGLYDNIPYEVFTFRPNQECNIPTHKGTITKLGKEHYSFDSEYLNVDNIVLAITDVEEKAATLNASLALRHGVKIKFITKTLKKVNDNITSFSSAMCRILNKYTEREVVKNESCPECGGQIVNEGGCVHCVECGWSRCS